MVSLPMSAVLCVAVLSGLALGAVEVGGSCDGSCPEGWVSFNGRCFKCVGSKMIWADAELHCVGLGGNLASVHTEDEHQFLRELYKRQDPSESPYWVGLTDCQKEGGWLWSDGSKVDYTKWNKGEPNNVNHGENCVHTNWSSQKMWNDIPCTHQYAFICALRSDAAGLV